MKPYINQNPAFNGCDFIVQLDAERKNTPIKLLQLTDMQIIDAQQRRTPDRLRRDEIIAWSPDNFMAQCGNHIASLITQIKPDLIFITGDIIYGSFDDSGHTLEWFCSFMDSFKIPWAPTFGNHDNESTKGIAWQCAQFENSQYCIFRRGTVSGNSNYTVGIVAGDELLRLLHMIDSNGCYNPEGTTILLEKGIYPDQFDLIRQNTAKIRQAQGHSVPAFMAFHIPTDIFHQIAKEKGYETAAHPEYTIGVDVPAKDDDFGFCYESYSPIHTDCDFLKFLHDQNIDGVFTGHCHRICTCIRYENIRFVFGLKTGQYDYHLPGNLGGTLITLQNETFDVMHVPALVPHAPMPGGAKFFEGFLLRE